MLGEVIFDSKDVSTVGAVMEVGLSMVIVLVIRSRSRKDFFFFLSKHIFHPETYITQTWLYQGSQWFQNYEVSFKFRVVQKSYLHTACLITKYCF